MFSQDTHHRMTIIAIANQKGGVGKTTTTVNLGAALQELGRRPLLIDLDPQGSLTAALGIDPEGCERTIYDALHAAANGAPIRLDELITVTGPGLALVPANLQLSLADVELSGGFRVYALRDALAHRRPGYDLILLDCPPNLGTLTLGALAAADAVLIPQQSDFLAARGLRLLLNQITEVQRLGNPALRLLGVVITMTDRTRHSRDVADSIRGLDARGVHVFTAAIPRRAAIRDAAALRLPVLAADPDGDAATAYRALAREVLER